MNDIIKRIYDYSLEEIMSERFSRYSKTIIQDRALPDVRDGLKPVQRRILFTMYKDKNTYDKQYRKSAKTVGNVMASYHPHGDSSIYEAMVRMSQYWKQSHIYVDMHGNNGSMDGDSPAAMRYTEARLSKISNELLKDLDKDTVKLAPNYDDTAVEPTVLPARFPNLLVGGSSGISAGYATNIPTHNLGEVIDATIKRIESPNCHLDTILELIKGPDFPTGGIVEGIEGIKDAFKTGRGKIIIKAKTTFEKTKGKDQIIITEIPFEVNKATLVKKMDEIRIDKKIEGILEVRDETDRDGLRIAIDLKKDAPKDLILNYLFKNTDLLVSYNYNMVAIVNRRPMTLGILEILDAYIAHQKEIITKRFEFDLDHALLRQHIVEGLIKAISILDEVIALIRKSSNKTNAIENLMNTYQFTERQAKEIVMLQLYRLTNTDIVELEEEARKLQIAIDGLREILADEEKLKARMKVELREIKKEYAVLRKTEIQDAVTEIKIDATAMINKEDVVVVVTREGYVKRVSYRSYTSNTDETTLKDGDVVSKLYKANTLDTLLLFTNHGNYLYVPVHEIPDLKWKELGKHISNIVKLDADEEIIDSLLVTDFNSNTKILLMTKLGMIKQTLLEEFKVTRYSKPITCIKLKANDELVGVVTDSNNQIFITTYNGYGLWFDRSEVSTLGIKASGVKAILLKDDKVVSINTFENIDNTLIVITTNGTAKRVKLTEFGKTTRGRKGIQIIREVKTNPYYILKTFISDNKEYYVLLSDSELINSKSTDFPLTDRHSTGTVVSNNKLIDVLIKAEIEIIKTEVREIEQVIEEVKPIARQMTLEEIDQEIDNIDNLLDDSKY